MKFSHLTAMLCLTACMAAPFCVSAQNISLTGRVSSEANSEPVPFATVVLSTDSLGRQGMKFTTTNANGQFTLRDVPTNPRQRWLTVRSVGYEQHSQRIDMSTVQSPLNIALATSTIGIEEVAVKARGRDVVQRGDTIVFNAQNYASGTEQNLGELISKMPGMEVDGGGRVSYQGQKIDKMLIDGRDVLSKASSGAAINTLSADFANSIELLTDYNEGDVTDKFKNKETLALNIKSGRKAAFNGNIEAGGGINNRYLAKATVFAFMPKFTVSILGNANNTGETTLSMQDYIANVVGYSNLVSGSSGGGFMEFSSAMHQMLFPPSNEYARRAQMLNLNATWEPTEKYKLRYNIIAHGSKSHGGEEQLQRYTLPDSTFTNTSRTEKQKSGVLYSQHLDQRWRPSERFTLKANTMLDISNSAYNATFTDVYGNARMQSFDHTNNTGLDAHQTLDIGLQVGEGLLSLGGIAKFTQGATHENLGTNTPLLPMPFAAASGEYTALYALNRAERSSEAQGHLGMIYPIVAGINAKADLQARYGIEHYDIATPSLTDTARENLTRTALQGYLGLMRNNGMFRFNCGAHVSAHKARTPYTQIDTSMVCIEPHLNFSLRFSKNHSLSLTATHKMSPNGLSDFLQTPWASGYSTMQQPSQLTNPFGQRLEIAAHYLLSSLFHGLLLFGVVAYSHDYNQALPVTDANGLLVNNYERDGGWATTTMGQVSVSKNIPYFDLKLAAQYTQTASNLVHLGEEDELQIQRFSTSFTAMSKFRQSPVNFELEAKYAPAVQHFDHGQARSNSQDLGGHAMLILGKGPWACTITGKYARTTDTQHEREVFDADLNMRYKFKKLELKLIGHNLLHINNYEWLSETLSSVVQSSSVYRRIPGHLMLALGWQF